jgi:GNAT superfamily N-acetyltransferase
MNIVDTSHYIDKIFQSNMHSVVVATVDNEIVGWLHVLYALRIETRPYCEITGLVVDEKYRGKGIGLQLIEHAIQWTRVKNCERIRVRTNMKRVETHKFYSIAGFTLVKEQKIFDRNI